MIFIVLTIFLWFFVIFYWIISTRNADREHKGNETFSFIKLIGSALIIYIPLLTGGFIATKLFTPTFISELLGTILCIIGILIMIWARQNLGKNWSGDVILQQEHSLSRSGLGSQPVERNTARIVRVESTQDRRGSPACYQIMPF